LKYKELRQRLVAVRGIGEHFQMASIDPLIRVGPALWGLNDRDVAIKRADQPKLVELLLGVLAKRGRGIHISELRDAGALASDIPPEAIFAIAALDTRLRVNTGQYLFLVEWGEPRRLSAPEAVREVLNEHNEPLHLTEIAKHAVRKLQRSCETRIISRLLINVGAKHLGESMWIRGEVADDTILQDDEEFG
jgi:hypothetical protein